MSNRLFGQLFEKETAVKLKPKIKTASYFTINSDLSNYQTPTFKISKNSFDECFFILSDEISRRLAIFSGECLQETVDNITPYGMAILDGGTRLAVIDKYGGGIGSGVSTLNFYSLNYDNNKTTLVDKTCRATKWYFS
ncbi:hypothetical protein HELRODRAFT_167007 [Helobdella robusta]|uniref:Uncharacterized protein n=1 Tax=Helobdella robusta TaxID=6412 RepID=T1EYW1_HELRO|nr:hypothetical protein HELRODRAFT_167007 [Helobdella robusta]ESO11914.1 hypothetical protein HELRODRAFT_167007 [Helobdella robusta]